MICRTQSPRASRCLVGILVAVVGVVLMPAAALANTVTIQSSSEGAITIQNGDFVAAGYQFTIPGSHPATTVAIQNAVVTISGPCSNGGTGTLTIPLSPGPYTVAANSNALTPSGPAGENDPISYQGSVTANVCGGSGSLNGSAGAVFTADIQASNTSNPLQIQFHYRDPNAKGMGNVNCQTAPLQPASVCGASWSSTSSLNPDAFQSSFSIVKQQQIAGTPPFTTSQLTGQVGQTVDYQMVVTNTGNTPLTFSSFTDPNCDAGTISGGPGSNPVAVGASTTYTCDHVLTSTDQSNGSYSNTAMVTGTPPSGEGTPVTNTSNTVVVVVPIIPAPAFSIVKEQMIVGSPPFTTATLTGQVGQTVDYEMLVTNTGNTALTFSNFTDSHCDPGTVAGGPGGNSIPAGGSTTFTCDHLLTSTDQANGSYSNNATVTGTPPSGQGSAITHTSNTVVVLVPPTPAPGFTIVKSQMIAGTPPFTTATLTGQVGQTVDYEMVVTNTGNTSLTFSNFTDAHCDPGTLSGGPGANPVAAGASTTYTCDHVLTSTDQTNGSYLNNATVTGSPPSGQGTPITNTSNTVVVNVPAAPAPSFTIVKEQQIAGAPPFTTATLTGQVGQTVDYEMVVTNTGNTSLTFSSFTDAHCDSGTITGGPGGASIAPGATTTWNCDHLLTVADQTVGSYSNNATVTGTPPSGSSITNTSNTVVVNVPATPAPSFTILKEQMIAGSGSFTTATLTGQVGQTVDYEILVTNTGNTTLTFSSFSDAHCDSGTIAGGPGGSAIAPGSTATWTCNHLLTAADQSAGSYSNTATVTGTPPTGSPITNTSNTVVVNVPATPTPNFTIVKEQQIAGSGSFTTATLTGQVGQTVDYQIVVTNTGNTNLTFSNFSDPHCDGGTIGGGSGGNAIAPGGSATWTCDHVLTAADQAAGSYSNTATVTGTPPTGSTITNTSNTVVVDLPATPTPSFTIMKEQAIGATGYTPAPLTGEVGQTVDYEMIVTNTGNTNLTFSSFTDAHCDSGTISGGPGSNSIPAGGTTTYFCDHVLTSTDQANGSYTNVASVTGTPPSGQGTPITNTSNTVLVNLPAPAPGYTIVKEQMIAGSGSGFTMSPLTGAVGETVDYEIVLTNTGNTPLTFSNFVDVHCDSGTISGGPGASAIAPGGTTTWTCQHVLTAADQAVGSYTNSASVVGTPPGGTPITNITNIVLVDLPAPPAPSFTILKEQTIAGSGAAFTTSTLTGAVGETVDYEILVSNNGNVALTFSNFTDPHCDAGTIAGGPGSSQLQPGSTTTYTCSHTLTSADQTAGSFTNTATITGTPPNGGPPSTIPSNSVVVNLPPSPTPSFTIAKQQMVAGSGSFTAATLSATVGQTIVYEIIVTNTGNTSLTFSNFSDPHCDAGTLGGGPGTNPVAAGTSTTFTCSHVVTAADQTNGSYANVATVTGTPPGGTPTTIPSNTVVVTVPSGGTPVNPDVTPGLSVVKKQKLSSSSSFTSGSIDAKVGDTIDYQIVATNTGKVTLKLTSFKDLKCDAGTVKDPSATSIAPGKSATWTCSHKITAMDGAALTNVAVVTATPPTGPALSGQGMVTLNVPKQAVAACTSTTAPATLTTSTTRGIVTSVVRGKHVKGVTFYMDGLKVETVSKPNAPNGGYAYAVDVSKTSYGKHTVKAMISHTTCSGALAAHASFVHAPPTKVVVPQFTG